MKGSTKIGRTRKSDENTRLAAGAVVGVLLGFFIGVIFQTSSVSMHSFGPELPTSIDMDFIDLDSPAAPPNIDKKIAAESNKSLSKIYTATNPRGAETLPPGILVPESDLYFRRLWGLPHEDLPPNTPKYLVAFAVGFNQSENINATLQKFSENFTVVLFHYDGREDEWGEFQWSHRAVHISTQNQTKWWFAKRFLHPDVIAAYDYIFIWDEDIGAENFDAEKYIELVKKHGLEISQPGVEDNGRLGWEMTKRIPDSEAHKQVSEKLGRCKKNPHSPPCAAFVELMVPVFSRDAWRCVWHLIQNDLVHGWGLDFEMRRCFESPYEKIGVIDSQWIVHQEIPSLGNQGQSSDTQASWQMVRERCKLEWSKFRARLSRAERTYLGGVRS